VVGKADVDYRLPARGVKKVTLSVERTSSRERLKEVLALSRTFNPKRIDLALAAGGPLAGRACCALTTAASSSPPRLIDWLAEHGVAAAFIERQPAANAFVDRFNGTMRTSSSTAKSSTASPRPAS
jgi:hypothetical protein